MAIRKIDTNIGTVPTWGDEDFDENVHENFTSLKNIVPKINNTVDDINVAVNEMNILKNQAENVTTTASNSASLASQKASEANTSANQALTYKNQVMGYVVPSGASYSVDQLNTKYSAMTKAQFNALAEEQKANRAGSGFDEWGKHANASGVGFVNINEGLFSYTLGIDTLYLGRKDPSGQSGVSKTSFPVVNINGVVSKIRGVATSSISTENFIQLPTAPTIYPYGTVLTTEQINSGVIKHADSSNSGLLLMGKNLIGTTFNQTVTVVNGKKYLIEYKDNDVRKTLEIIATSTSYIVSLSGTNITEVGMYPLDAISRSDLVFLESFHEDISEKNFVYPLGNVQYLGGNTDGLTGIANGAFTGFETYSNFGVWQTPSALIGKGYVWSSLTEAQKRAFIANPENNCYLDGDKTIQVRYRVRVVQGLGDNWINITTDASLRYDSNINNVALKGKLASITSDFVGDGLARFITYMATVAVAQASIGSFAPYNSINSAYEGKCFALPIALVHRRNQGMYHPVYNPNGSKKASDGNFWYNTAVSFTSISDCFDTSKLLTASGYIGSVSGRPDGLFYDQVHESDILDLRNSSKKVEDYNRLISREFNKLVGGSTRGKEGEYITLDSSGSSCYYKFDGNSAVLYGIAYKDVKDGGRIRPLDKAIVFNGTDMAVMQHLGIFNGTEIKWQRISGTLGGGIGLNIKTNTVYVLASPQTTRTKSNTLLHCDIIGNPTNYPTSWKQSGVFGTPLIVAEDGTSLLPDGAKDTFKLSRKANATPLLCLRSTDSGATWTSFTPTFSTTTNEITLTNEPANNLVMVYYQTKTSMAVPVANSEVLSFINPTGLNCNDKTQGAYLVDTLIGKSPIGVSAPTLLTRNLLASSLNPINKSFDSSYGFDAPTHSQMQFYNSYTPAVKILPYLTRTNGKAYLNLVFKEMKYNGTSWGDNDKFNIVGNVSTTTDNNAQTVLVGQKTVELPYFIAGDE